MARAVVRLPRLLLSQAGGVREHEVEADTVLGALEALCERLPALRPHVFERRGVPRRHVNVFQNGEILRFRGTLDVALHDGDEVDVVQAVSGGYSSIQG
jgi:molybdopterin converting factor small subunit